MWLVENGLLILIFGMVKLKKEMFEGRKVSDRIVSIDRHYVRSIVRGKETKSVYLYIIDLCTELDGLGFLASDDGTYIITVNADDAVTDFPPFKHFLFLYKLLSDDGKTLLVILCISE